jgi:uncharacterized membrane protein
MSKTTSSKRFNYIDQFRGFIGVLMLLGHSSYYFNSIWKNLNPLDPIFPSDSQFILRYIGYLCAPGFLMMAGAMVWWSYTKRVEKGVPTKTAKWHLIQRGLFLVFLQITWVNSSWSGFQMFKPGHLGIISTIGIAVLLLTLLVGVKWQIRLFFALLIFIVHPFLLQIQYDTSNILSNVLMQTFVDAGAFNKYPVLPWFALALMGSVMATGWLHNWQTDKKKIMMSFSIGSFAILLAFIVRLGRGFGTLSPYSDFGSYSFFLDQKYPPSLFLNLFFFGIVVLGVGGFILLNKYIPKVMSIFSIPGRVPLFFYGMHIAILGIFIKRMDFFYREGGVLASLIGLVVMSLIMLPLSQWFYKVKRRSNNFIIRLI